MTENRAVVAETKGPAATFAASVHAQRTALYGVPAHAPRTAYSAHALCISAHCISGTLHIVYCIILHHTAYEFSVPHTRGGTAGACWHSGTWHQRAWPRLQFYTLSRRAHHATSAHLVAFKLQFRRAGHVPGPPVSVWLSHSPGGARDARPRQLDARLVVGNDHLSQLRAATAVAFCHKFRPWQAVRGRLCYKTNN